MEAGIKVTSKFITLPLFSSEIGRIVNRFWARSSYIGSSVTLGKLLADVVGYIMASKACSCWDSGWFLT